MSNHAYPFAVRLLGFSEQELDAFDAAFSVKQGKGRKYFRLADDNLQDPDLYIANGNELKALIALADLRPSNVRPALLIGGGDIALPYPCVDRPILWPKVFELLAALVEKRADALSRLEVAKIVTVAERRRGERLDLDLTDPAEYERMRSTIARDGIVLVVDKKPAFRDCLSDFLVRHNVPVAWASDEMQALEQCRQKSVALVMINTSTPNVDPYRLCWAIKEKDVPVKIAVVFLIRKPFVYDLQQARYVGVDGFLYKPLASHHLIAVLKKFLPLSH